MIRLLFLILLFSLPLSAWSHGDLHDQIDKISQHIHSGKPEAALYLKRGQLYLQHGNYPDAIVDLGKSMELDPKLKVAHYHLAQAYLAEGSSDTAEQHIKLFLKSLGPDTYGGLSRGYGLLGKIHQKKNEHMEAVQAFEKSLKNNTLPAPVDYLQIARSYVKSGQQYQQKAIDILDQGIVRLGPVVTLQEEAIELELLLGNYDAALGRVETLRSQGISDANIFFKQASVMSKAGRFEEAQGCYKKALAEIERLPAYKQQSRVIVKLRHSIEDDMSKLEDKNESTGKAMTNSSSSRS
ncbi:MAG: hypothetical protein B7Y56_00315 [Gallionellales bacterium 35-53-114]|jgi:tetratricopeptide (TPR) repeat protein|nr:MAG: hypothetical protein B7Y56_00315 [Gallionellales bacterium 35-53-114]OYZ62280.1 MAG: hypothetical protein B7Y04_14945 [Gallionellales bacterium 24-53-125]OZB10597.1 MAG: hypothetical protein B7X61_03595 [Gallionellales bacterium 39-52-133]HQS57230.1 tetratricopeptide repeat protein [Gallionellaceae bacterium]HQS74582.1 tetratricopeptide repeat protein [Gallionellaceae bacterium]